MSVSVFGELKSEFISVHRCGIAYTIECDRKDFCDTELLDENIHMNNNHQLS